MVTGSRKSQQKNEATPLKKPTADRSKTREDDHRFEDLRLEVEGKLKEIENGLAMIPDEGIQQLVQELHVHQMELEIQNEELRRAQAELEESRSKYSYLYDFAPIGYFTFDQCGTILEINLTGAKQLGYERSRLVGRPLAPYLQAGQEQAFYSHLKKVFELREEQSCELIIRRKDGFQFDARLESRASDRDGNTQCLTAVIDITEHRQTEEELHRLNKTLKALSDSSQATIRAEDEQEYLDEVCRIIIEDCGYSMVWIGFAEDDKAKSVRPVAYAGFEEGYLKTLELTWAETERGRGPTGTAIRTGTVAVCRNMLTDPAFAPWREQARQRGYASSIVFPLRSKNKVFGAITIYSKEADPFSEAEVKLLTELADDLSYGIEALQTRSARLKAEEELHKLTEELKRSNTDLQQFAYAASHDLQEPLRGIAGFTRLLEKRYKGKLDEKADEFMDYIIGDARRMQELIKDLLEYSRIETKLKVMKPANCAVVLEEAFYNLRSIIEETRTELTYDYLPTVMADASQLKSLFQNLVGNAIKFHSQEKPRIHISAERRGDDWVFSVKDNGIGFESGFAERIFVVFQRLHARQEYPGTGIGLAICKKIVERHGGRIWAESKPAEGSTFYFTLPVMNELESTVEH
jgi:PAS domain S-box-containing protein